MGIFSIKKAKRNKLNSFGNNFGVCNGLEPLSYTFQSQKICRTGHLTNSDPFPRFFLWRWNLWFYSTVMFASSMAKNLEPLIQCSLFHALYWHETYGRCRTSPCSNLQSSFAWQSSRQLPLAARTLTPTLYRHFLLSLSSVTYTYKKKQNGASRWKKTIEIPFS